MNSAASSETESSSSPPPPTLKAWQETLSFVKTIGILLLLAIFIRGTLIEAFKIPSGSMIPTLRIGDHILVSKLSYGIRLPFVEKLIFQYAEPERGDIVVFTRVDESRTIEDESRDNVIKRVIGIPGDEIEVQRNRLYVNKVLQEEPYARWENGGDPLGNFGPKVVPEGHLLLLGDNRDHSRDSRFWQDPFLPQERLKGRALFVYWSWDQLSRIGTILR
ncbi:signal peptidase I [bacterium]|nr:signal peptidase I [bacterium]